MRDAQDTVFRVSSEVCQRPARRRRRRPAAIDVIGLLGIGGAAFAAALGIPMRRWEGGHEGDDWGAHFDRYLRFYADGLESG
jgi:hypothetical protein